MRAVAATIALALAWQPPAAAAELARFGGPPQKEQLEVVEGRLWYQADEQDAALRNVGAIHDDPALDAYLRELTAKLFPEMGDSLRIRVVRDAQPNAFMMPNGSGYFHAGMLALLENEAQLATILAHEGGHFIDRHGFRNHQRGTIAGTIGSWVSLGGLAASVLAGVFAASSVYGYSRELEAGADATALERLRAAGYDLNEAGKPFAALGAYYTTHKIKEPLFYATHPKLKERIAFFGNAAKDAPAGATNTETYRAMTQGVRMFVLTDMMRQRDHATLIHLLDDEAARAAWPKASGYHLAVALRQRAQEGDAERANALLEQTLLDAPEFAPTHKALGDVVYKAGDLPRARTLYLRYLELSPDAADRAFVERNLSKIPSGEQP